MFGWFQRLLPRSGDFFSLFERHGASVVAASESLDALIRGATDRTTAIAAIRDHEHDADSVVRETLQTVRKTFLTPFDRGAITSLIGAMDDVIDEMNKAASAIENYDVTTFDPEMAQIAAIAAQASKTISRALPLLRDIERNGQQLHEMTGELVSLEGTVDNLYDKGMRAQHQQAKSGGAVVDFIVAREVYKHLERIADSFEDVANEIDSLVIDHS